MTLDRDHLDAALPQMQSGLFHLCFTRDLRTFSTGSDGEVVESMPAYNVSTWLPSGVSLRIQDEILGLSVNGVQHARGLRSFIPLRGSNAIEFFRRSSPLLLGEAISLIPSSDFCSSAPAECSNVSSGHLLSNAIRGMVLWGQLCTMKPGIYQVCHRRTTQTAFQTTGLSLTLQDMVISASVNDMEMGGGHRITIPKVSKTRMFFSTNSTSDRFFFPYHFLPSPGDRQGLTAMHSSRMYLSIIPSLADCEDVRENPVEAGPLHIPAQPHMPASVHDDIWESGQDRSPLVNLRASGHLSTQIEVVYYRELNQTRPRGVHLDEPTLWAGISALPTGSYQICMAVKSHPDISKVLFLQEDADSSGDLDGAELRQVLQQLGVYENDEALNEDFSALDANRDGAISLQEAVGKTFHSSGIGVLIQSDVKALWVNYLNPNGGIRVNAPRAIGNHFVARGNRSNFEGFVLSLIRPDGDCNNARDNPARCDLISTSNASTYPDECGPVGNHVSGFMSLSASGLVQDTTRVSLLDTGLYQVCVMKANSPQPSVPGFPDVGATGVSLRLHSAVLDFKSNGISPGKGNRLALPLVAGNTVSYKVMNASAGHWLSLIDPSDECRLDAVATGVPMLRPKVSWRLQGQQPFSVAWYSNQSDVLLSLEVSCRNSSLLNCTAGGTYLLGMRSKNRSASNWSAYEYVEYPGTQPKPVDWAVTVEDDGFAISWDGEVRHIYRHRLLWADFARVQTGGSVRATMDERVSYRRYQMMEEDVDLISTSLAAGIYQVCFSPEGTASKQTFLGGNVADESDLAMGTGISVSIQTSLIGLEVNGIAYLPRRHPQGIVATAPLRRGLVLRALGEAFIPRTGFNSFNDSSNESAVALIAADGDCANVDNATQCVDASCENPLLLDTKIRASGHLAAQVEDASLRSTEGLARLPSGLYQVCVRLAASGNMIGAGISIELQTRIQGIWVNDPQMHDGLHSVASRRDLNVIFVRGYLPTNKKSAQVSGRITLLATAPASSALNAQAMTCARLPKTSIPHFRVNSSQETIEQGPWDAAWGYSGTEPSGLYELCIQNTDDKPFVATGISIDIRPASVSKVTSILVNGIQSWGVSAVPFGVSNNELTFEIAGTDYTSDMYFMISSTTSGRTCAQQATFDFPPKFPTHSAQLGPRMGRWNQSQVNEVWSVAIGGANAGVHYKVCFSESGPSGPYVDTGLLLYGQRNVSGITLNDQVLQDGRILYLSNVTDERIAIQRQPAVCSSGDGSQPSDQCLFRPRPYQIGDAISLISLQGNCADAFDNPIASTGSASGVMFTPLADGVIDYNDQIQRLGPYQYQVCIRGVDEYKFYHTGIRVDVLQNYSLRVLGVVTGEASRSDVSLPMLTVKLENPAGVLVPYFDSAARPYASSSSTRIVLHLFRCRSRCGTLINDLSACSEACPVSSWENVTQYVSGNDAPVVGGLATYTNLTVLTNAGRFYLRAGWVRDHRLTWGDTAEFVVMPNHIVTAGVVNGDQYLVKSVPSQASTACDLDLLPRDDVRCRGTAFLPQIRSVTCGR